MDYLIFDSETFVEIEKPCKVKAVQTNGRCPACDKPGIWRLGVYFEHEKRCPECSIIWEPGKTYLIVTNG